MGILMIATIIVLAEGWNKPCNSDLKNILIGWAVLYGINGIVVWIRFFLTLAGAEKASVLLNCCLCPLSVFTISWYVYSICEYSNTGVCASGARSYLLSHVHFLHLLPKYACLAKEHYVILILHCSLGTLPGDSSCEEYCI